MENGLEVNGTALIHYEPGNEFIVFNCSLLSLTLLVGLSGNLLVCWVVYKHKSLQTANNALLVNLAASDLLKCLLDTPIFLVSLLLGKRRAFIGVVLCCSQQFSYSLCSCAQLLTLVVTSLERFQAIAHPFKTETTKRRIRVWIVSIWFCGLFVAILSLTLCEDSLSYMTCRHLTSPKTSDSPSDPFGAFVLVPIWAISVILITIHYLRIFIVVRHHTNKIYDRGIQFKSSISRQVSCWPSGPVSAPRTSTTALPRPDLSVQKHQLTESGGDAGSTRNVYVAKSTVTPHSGTPEIVGAVCILTPTAREFGKKRLEGRMAKRFGYIILAVILFWVPLVVALLLNLFVDRNKPSSWMLRQLETSAMVLTCVPAAVDPVIYTLLNRQFRSEVHKLLSHARACLTPLHR